MTRRELRLSALRLAALRLAPLRLAPLRLAPLLLAPLLLAPQLLAPLRLAPVRLAPLLLASSCAGQLSRQGRSEPGHRRPRGILQRIAEDEDCGGDGEEESGRPGGVEALPTLLRAQPTRDQQGRQPAQQG